MKLNMKSYLLVLPLILATAGAAGSVSAQVSKSKTGVGFSNYGTYKQLDIGTVQTTPARSQGKVSTGRSDVPVYAAKSRGLRFRQLSQKDAASIALQLGGLNGMAMRGVPIQAGDVIGQLRIVQYDRHVFGVVDGLREPLRGSGLSDRALGRSLTGQVARRTGCAVNGPPLMQFNPGYLNKLSVPLRC